MGFYKVEYTKEAENSDELVYDLDFDGNVAELAAATIQIMLSNEVFRAMILTAAETYKKL